MFKIENIIFLLIFGLLGGLFISLSLIPGLYITNTEVETELNSNVDIRIDETAIISDPLIRVTLNSVLEDSRCTIDVDCVWEGDVKISVNIFTIGYQVNHNMTLNDIIENKISFSSYYVKFQDVKPVPESDITISEDAYIVTFYIGEYGPD